MIRGRIERCEHDRPRAGCPECDTPTGGALVGLGWWMLFALICVVIWRLAG